MSGPPMGEYWGYFRSRTRSFHRSQACPRLYHRSRACPRSGSSLLGFATLGFSVFRLSVRSMFCQVFCQAAWRDLLPPVHRRPVFGRSVIERRVSPVVARRLAEGG